MIAAAKGSGGRGRVYARMKRDLTAVVKTLAERAKLPKFPARVVLEFTWVEQDRRRDPDNVAAARKFVLDGLVAAGVLRGDGWRFVQAWTDRFEVAGASSIGPGVGVVLHEYAGAVQVVDSRP